MDWRTRKTQLNVFTRTGGKTFSTSPDGWIGEEYVGILHANGMEYEGEVRFFHRSISYLLLALLPYPPTGLGGRFGPMQKQFSRQDKTNNNTHVNTSTNYIVGDVRDKTA